MDEKELKKLTSNIRTIHERSERISPLCVPVSERIQRLNEVMTVNQVLISGVAIRAAIHYCQLVADFLKALREYEYRPYVLYRLARCMELVDQVRRAHMRLDEVYNDLGIQEDEALGTAWVANWERDLDAQDAWFFTNVANMPASILVNEVQNLQHRAEIWAELKKQQDVRESDPSPMVITRPGRQPVSIQANVSPAMHYLILTKYAESLRVMSRTEPEVEFKWFVVARAVTVEKKKFAVGPFSKLYHASWDDARTGQHYDNVSYKLLTSAVDVSAEKLFYREIAVWWGLDHPNILRLFGANHISRFFLCELAESNFASFFEHRSNSSRLWSLFIQAGNGLVYLHSKNIEYGGVKCNNLLLVRDEGGEPVVKLSDFGMSAVRNASVVLSAEAKSDTARWKAPERLDYNGGRVDFERSDTYSLGLCIIEAVTGETPFGMMGTEEIVNMKLEHTLVERPSEGFSDDEWALVSRMCDPYPKNRPTMIEVLNGMAQLDLVRRGVDDVAMGG